MRPIQMSEEEYCGMLQQIIAGAGPDGILRDELERIVAALHQMRVDAGLVELFDRGELIVRWQGDDITFKINEKGIRTASLVGAKRWQGS